jgi:uncharacterized protein
MAQLPQLAELAELEQLLAQLLTPEDLRGRTRLLVLQGTPFCNIACDYCYLPNRADRSRMPFNILASTIDWIFRHDLAADDLTIVWHAGEPLVLPLQWYEQAFAVIATASGMRHGFSHSIQTNGMLLTEAWCDFLLQHRVSIGVSLDGPAFLHDSRRRTRRGHGTHASVMRGIELLRRRGVPFHIICVITRETLEVADALMDFFLGHRIHTIGFNIEEIEGINLDSTLMIQGVEDLFRRFLARIVDRALAADEPVYLREIESVGGFLRHPQYGKRFANSQNNPFEIVTVTRQGDIITFSPELAGNKSTRHQDFVVGNVARDSLLDVVQREPFIGMWREIHAGTAACRDACSYFDVCLGGAPANKLAEHGKFDAVETLFCQLTTKAVVDTVLSRVQGSVPEIGTGAHVP